MRVVNSITLTMAVSSNGAIANTTITVDIVFADTTVSFTDIRAVSVGSDDVTYCLRRCREMVTTLVVVVMVVVVVLNAPTTDVPIIVHIDAVNVTIVIMIIFVVIVIDTVIISIFTITSITTTVVIIGSINNIIDDATS